MACILYKDCKKVKPGKFEVASFPEGRIQTSLKETRVEAHFYLAASLTSVNLKELYLKI